MTKRLTFRAAAVGFAFSGLLAVAACGGDDSSDDSTTVTTEQTADTGTDDGTDMTTDDGTGTDDGTDTATDGTDEGTDMTTGEGTESPSVGGVSAECQAVAQEFTEALGGATNPTVGPEEVAEAFAEIADSVPADLKDDVELVGKALGTYAEVVANHDGDLTAAASDPEALTAIQELGSPEYAAATQAIADYFSETCQPG